jgi:DNA-binding NarL/FixJ family response regulator
MEVSMNRSDQGPDTGVPPSYLNPWDRPPKAASSSAHYAAPRQVEAGVALFLQSSETGELLKTIVEWVIELLGVDGAEIYLYDGREQQLRLCVACGSEERYYGATLGPGEGLAGKVFATGDLIRVDDYGHWEGRAPKFGETPPFQAEIGVPLKWHERCVGVLVLVSDTRKRPLSEADVRAARLCANLVATAIENARLYQELHSSLQQLKHTLEQEIAERTDEIARQTAQVARSGMGGGEAPAGLNTEELLARVVELRIAKKVLAEIARVPLETPSREDLTPREIQILNLIGSGRSNKEIAYELKLAVSTVKFHVGGILSKLNLPDRTQAALWAARTGLVSNKNDGSGSLP